MRIITILKGVSLLCEGLNRLKSFGDLFGDDERPAVGYSFTSVQKHKQESFNT